MRFRVRSRQESSGSDPTLEVELKVSERFRGIRMSRVEGLTLSPQRRASLEGDMLLDYGVDGHDKSQSMQRSRAMFAPLTRLKDAMIWDIQR